MSNQKEQFNQAALRAITYGDVMSRLNEISRGAGANTAHYNTNLKKTDGKTVSGFEFSTHELAEKLGKLLSDLGIMYSDAAGRLIITDADRVRADELFYGWTSWSIIEPRITGNAEMDAKWRRVVNKSR